jgi:hypothetical protein
MASGSSAVSSTAAASQSSCRRSVCFCKAASVRLRAVMSCAIFDAPTTSPSEFLSGEIVKDTWTRFPSLATRTVS